MSQTIAIDRLVDEQRIRWFNVSLLIWSLLAMFADGYDINALSQAQPELERLWHIPKVEFGLVSSASLWGILLGAPLLGWVGDRYGRKAAIIAGSIAYGLCSLAVTATHDLHQVFVLRFLTGIGLGGVMPNTIALNSELSPKRLRATLITLMFVGITLGSSAPGITAYAWMPQYGWRVLFWVGGLVPLAVSVGLIFALPESVKFLALRGDRPREVLALARRMRPDLTIAEDTRFLYTQDAARPGGAIGLRRLFAGFLRLFAGGLAWITPLLWLCFATALMSNYFLNSFLPLIFRDSGMPLRQAALASSLYSIGGTVGGLLMSVLLDRFGFVVIAFLFVAAVPAIAALGFAPTTFVALAPLATLSGLAVLGAQFGNNASSGLLYPTAVRAKGVGWALGIGRFGAIVGPTAGAYLLGRPLHQLFLIASAPMLVGAIAAVVLVRLCYARLGGLKLSDVPASEGARVSGDASASLS
ncbi:MAG TPA: MFS transporter [Steroidobacteraceae bacterium]|nr:MFS transporter [Steroidobacteraceae bacterium]